MTAIYLIGFMGTGKTTVGMELAEKLGYSFHDSDQVVMDRTGKSISEIFAEVGENGFRSLEQQILQSLPTEKCIIATGGGIILKTANRKYMMENGTVIWLDATPTEIIRRLETDSSRPLLSGNKNEQIQSLYRQRADLYKQAANFRVNTEDKSISEIIDEIIKKKKKSETN